MFCRREGIYLAAVVSVLAVLCTGCKGAGTEDDGLMLHLAFEEQGGTTIVDSAGKVQDASLLFDGCSTYIDYSADEICVGGDTFSVSVWVAPRAFEWDDPDAAENGTGYLTAIVSQYDKNKNQGVLLGYQRFGRLCFQVGTGEDWITLWGGECKSGSYHTDRKLSGAGWRVIRRCSDGCKRRSYIVL